MGKTTFKPTPDLSQKLLAAFGYGSVEIDPTRDFLTVGTPRDNHVDLELNLSSNDLK